MGWMRQGRRCCVSWLDHEPEGDQHDFEQHRGVFQNLSQLAVEKIIELGFDKIVNLRDRSRGLEEKKHNCIY